MPRFHRSQRLPVAAARITTRAHRSLTTPRRIFILGSAAAPIKKRTPNSREDPRPFPCSWPGPRDKNFLLPEFRATAQRISCEDPSPLNPNSSHVLWEAEQSQAPGPIPIPLQVVPNYGPDPRLTHPLSPCAGRPPHGSKTRCERLPSGLLQTQTTHVTSATALPDNHTCPCSNIPRVGDGELQPQAVADRDPSRMPSPVPPDGDLHPGARDRDGNAGLDTPTNLRLSAVVGSGGVRQASARRPRPVFHSANHAPFRCPLTASLRSDIIGTTSRFNLFHTVEGAKKLALFLLKSNTLLRPLAPRPDPP